MVCSVSSLIMPRPNKKRIRHSPDHRLRIRSGERFSAGKPSASPTAVPRSTPENTSCHFFGDGSKFIRPLNKRLQVVKQKFNFVTTRQNSQPCPGNRVQTITDAG